MKVSLSFCGGADRMQVHRVIGEDEHQRGRVLHHVGREHQGLQEQVQQRAAKQRPHQAAQTKTLYSLLSSAVARNGCTQENYRRKEWKRVANDCYLTSDGGTRNQPSSCSDQSFDEVVQLPLGFCCL